MMAYLEGESLDKRIEQGPLSLETAYEIARQAAEGLSAAHAAGVVHRDIKSSNIMLSEDRAGKPVAKLMDFGLAQVTGASKLTRVDTRVGTTAYMSPEQALGDPVDARTDLWSLGVVLHEMVVGELPFKGHYDQAILYSILNEEPEPVTSLRSPRADGTGVDHREVPGEGPPADRYQDARELIVDIERPAAARGLRPDRVPASGPFRQSRPSRRPPKPRRGTRPWVRAVVERRQAIAPRRHSRGGRLRGGLGVVGRGCGDRPGDPPVHAPTGEQPGRGTGHRACRDLARMGGTSRSPPAAPAARSGFSAEPPRALPSGRGRGRAAGLLVARQQLRGLYQQHRLGQVRLARPRADHAGGRIEPGHLGRDLERRWPVHHLCPRSAGRCSACRPWEALRGRLSISPLDAAEW